MADKPAAPATPKPEGYRAVFNLNKEDLLFSVAEWILEVEEHGYDVNSTTRKNACNRIKHYLDRVKFTRARFWVERRPEDGHVPDKVSAPV